MSYDSPLGAHIVPSLTFFRRCSLAQPCPTAWARITTLRAMGAWTLGSTGEHKCGGCVNDPNVHTSVHTRDREPWEASDGALHLMEQLALAVTATSAISATAKSGAGGGPMRPPQLVPNSPSHATAQPTVPTGPQTAAVNPATASGTAATAVLDTIVQLLPSLPDIAELRSFRRAAALRETLWTCLPGIAKALGECSKGRSIPFQGSGGGDGRERWRGCKGAVEGCVLGYMQ